MIVSFLKDLKEYFKKAALLSEDKTYSRILKVAESTQKYIPQFYCLTNIALKLVAQIRARVDDVNLRIIKEIRRYERKYEFKELNKN